MPCEEGGEEATSQVEASYLHDGVRGEIALGAIYRQTYQEGAYRGEEGGACQGVASSQELA